jgi:hypothetical protein
MFIARRLWRVAIKLAMYAAVIAVTLMYSRQSYALDRGRFIEGEFYTLTLVRPARA